MNDPAADATVFTTTPTPARGFPHPPSPSPPLISAVSGGQGGRQFSLGSQRISSDLREIAPNAWAKKNQYTMKLMTNQIRSSAFIDVRFPVSLPF